MRALILLTLLAIGRASSGQSGAEPPPDSPVVCFTVAEAKEIGDTLWSRLDDREKRRLAHVVLNRTTEAAAKANEEADRLRASVAPLAESEAAARTEAESRRDEALKWQLKARGRGGRGLVLGIGLGALATYGGLRLLGGPR